MIHAIQCTVCVKLIKTTAIPNSDLYDLVRKTYNIQYSKLKLIRNLILQYMVTTV